MLRNGARYLYTRAILFQAPYGSSVVASLLHCCMCRCWKAVSYRETLLSRSGSVWRRARFIKPVSRSTKRETTNWGIPFLLSLDIFRRNIISPIFAVIDLSCHGISVFEVFINLVISKWMGLLIEFDWTWCVFHEVLNLSFLNLANTYLVANFRKLIVHFIWGNYFEQK